MNSVAGGITVTRRSARLAGWALPLGKRPGKLARHLCLKQVEAPPRTAYSVSQPFPVESETAQKAGHPALVEPIIRKDLFPSIIQQLRITRVRKLVQLQVVA